MVTEFSSLTTTQFWVSLNYISQRPKSMRTNGRKLLIKEPNRRSVHITFGVQVYPSAAAEVLILERAQGRSCHGSGPLRTFCTNRGPQRHYSNDTPPYFTLRKCCFRVPKPHTPQPAPGSMHFAVFCCWSRVLSIPFYRR